MIVRWLSEAADDLEGIHTYLLEHLPSYADGTMLEIYDAVQSLGEMPHRGKPGRTPNTREFVLPQLPYIVFYRVREESVEILYIRHGAQRRRGRPLP